MSLTDHSRKILETIAHANGVRIHRIGASALLKAFSKGGAKIDLYPHKTHGSDRAVVAVGSVRFPVIHDDPVDINGDVKEAARIILMRYYLDRADAAKEKAATLSLTLT